MSRILAFTSGPEDWKALLADPEKHWRTGYSARTLAYAWEAAEGFPPEVAEVFSSGSAEELRDLVPLLAVPEFKVPLPGGRRPSQNDIFVLGRSRAGPVTIMVEGKVNEPFGPTLDEWKADASEGKQVRLAFLLEKLGLANEPPGTIRYQLMHRAASALVAAEQYRAVAAVLLVHSFSPSRAGYADYQAFVALFGGKGPFGGIERLGGPTGIPLFAAWVPGDPVFLGR